MFNRNNRLFGSTEEASHFRLVCLALALSLVVLFSIFAIPNSVFTEVSWIVGAGAIGIGFVECCCISAIVIGFVSRGMLFLSKPIREKIDAIIVEYREHILLVSICICSTLTVVAYYQVPARKPLIIIIGMLFFFQNTYR